MEKCNELVFKYGEDMGVYEASKEYANRRVAEMNVECPDYIHDWHYYAGRVAVKRLSVKRMNEILDSEGTE